MVAEAVASSSVAVLANPFKRRCPRLNEPTIGKRRHGRRLHAATAEVGQSLHSLGFRCSGVEK